MSIDNTDRGFAVKISSLFMVLAIGVLLNKIQPHSNNSNQDIIKTENNSKPAVIQTISIKKTNSQQFYNNPLR